MGVDDIGREVGITGPAVYRHFSSKEAVLDAVLTAVAAELTTSLTSAGEVAGVQLVDVVLDAALSDPAGLATLLREGRRLSADRPAVARAGDLLRGLVHRAVVDIHPELDEVSALMRCTSLETLLGSGVLVYAETSISRPRLDELLRASMLAMIRSPGIVHPAPIRSASRWLPRPNRRAQIRAAALALFRQRGFTQVSVEEIAQSIGLSGPAVYYYFPSKAAILDDAFVHAAHRFQIGFEQALAGATTPAAALEALVRSLVAVSVDNLDLAVVYGRAMGPLLSEQRAEHAAGWEEMRSIWASVLAATRPDLSEHEAHLLVRVAPPMAFETAQLVEAHPGRREELTSLVLAHFGCAASGER